jgi:hypothetical protein
LLLDRCRRWVGGVQDASLELQVALLDQLLDQLFDAAFGLSQVPGNVLDRTAAVIVANRQIVDQIQNDLAGQPTPS